MDGADNIDILITRSSRDGDVAVYKVYIAQEFIEQNKDYPEYLAHYIMLLVYTSIYGSVSDVNPEDLLEAVDSIFVGLSEPFQELELEFTSPSE